MILYSYFCLCSWGKKKLFADASHTSHAKKQPSWLPLIWKLLRRKLHNKTESSNVSFGRELRKKALAIATSQEKNLTFLKNSYWPVWTGNGKSDRSHRQAAVSSLLTFKCHLVSSENQGNANNRALGKGVLYQGYLLKTNISWLPFL